MSTFSRQAKSKSPDEKTARSSGGSSQAPNPYADLQHKLGNRATLGLIAGAQAKLEVGAANDPFEIEADRTAEQVVKRLLASPGSGAPDGDGSDDSGSGVLRGIGTIHRVQRVASARAIGPAGGAVDSGTEASIVAARRRGRPLPSGTREDMEGAFGADFGDVRVHRGQESEDLNARVGALAFTVGSDIFLGRSVPDVHSPAAAHLLAHELTHTLQQRGSRVSRRVMTNSADVHIQRHASWEHKMLGDVDPAQLEVIAAGRDLVAENKSASKEKRPEKTLTAEDGKVLDADTVLHAIEQEITRLQTFAKNAPNVATREEEQQRVTQDAAAQQQQGGGGQEGEVQQPAQKWQVRLVGVPLKDGSKAVLTYGEVNTLADFFGSTDQIRQTDPQQFRNYVYGIREESIRKFMRLHTEVSKGLGREQKYDGDAKENKVQDETATSMGNTGAKGKGVVGSIAGGDAYGELKMMGQVPKPTAEEKAEKRYEIPGQQETGYTAGLGRNACHFAPQSWHAWAEAHDKGVLLAQQAYALRKSVTDEQELAKKNLTVPSFETAQKWKADKEKAEELENEALLENGFGDHFLQDSYAAGHLINKTLIMQWFTKWLDEHKGKRDYTSDDNWRRVQNVAYGQEGIAGKDLYSKEIGTAKSNDPQTVENMKGSWQDRFGQLGLKVPESVTDPESDTFILLSWWQDQAAKKSDKAKSDISKLIKEGPLPDREVLTAALQALIKDGVVFYDNFSSGDRKKGPEAIGLSGTFGAKPLRLSKQYIPKDKEGFSEMTGDIEQEGDDSEGYEEYQDKAKSVAYGDYHTFLNHGYLQMSTNVLHNYFCENGLYVNNDEGQIGYKIYGDNNMLQAESGKMVKYSGETSHMSRDSIIDLATKGATDKTTQAIAARIPKKVSAVKGGATVGLEEWHGDDKSSGLKKLCWETVFPECAAFFSKSTAIAKDTLAPKISKDAEAGEAF